MDEENVASIKISVKVSVKMAENMGMFFEKAAVGDKEPYLLY